MSNRICLILSSLCLVFMTNQSAGVQQVECPNGLISLDSDIASVQTLPSHKGSNERVECKFVLTITASPTIIALTTIKTGKCKKRKKKGSMKIESTDYKLDWCKENNECHSTKRHNLTLEFKTEGGYTMNISLMVRPMESLMVTPSSIGTTPLSIPSLNNSMVGYITSNPGVCSKNGFTYNRRTNYSIKLRAPQEHEATWTFTLVKGSLPNKRSGATFHISVGQRSKRITSLQLLEAPLTSSTIIELMLVTGRRKHEGFLLAYTVRMKRTVIQHATSTSTPMAAATTSEAKAAEVTTRVAEHTTTSTARVKVTATMTSTTQTKHTATAMSTTRAKVTATRTTKTKATAIATKKSAIKTKAKLHTSNDDTVQVAVGVTIGAIVVVVIVAAAVILCRYKRPSSNGGVVRSHKYTERQTYMEDSKGISGQENLGDNEYAYIDGNLYTQSPRAADPTVYEVVCDKSRPLQLSATQSLPDDPIYFGEQRDETYHLDDQDDTTLNRSDVVPQGKTTPTVYSAADEQRQSHTYVTGLDDRDEGHIYSKLENSVTNESGGRKQLTSKKEGAGSDDEPQYHVLDNTTEEVSLQPANGTDDPVERDDPEYHELEVTTPADTEQTTWCDNDCYDKMRDAPTTNKTVPINNSDNVPVDDSHDYAVLETPHTSDKRSE